MKYSIKISKVDFEQVKTILFKYKPKENALFLLIGQANSKNIINFLVRRIIEIPGKEVIVRTNNHLEISSKAINGIIALCEANKLGLIVCHSHLNSFNEYSYSDNFGEKRLKEIFYKFMPNYPFISLLISNNGFKSRLWKNNNQLETIKNIKVIGRRIEELGENEYIGISDKKIYDRQILAFGEMGQKIISNAKVGIIGVGGTGSAVAEQLVRLGVKDFIIVDKDYFDSSNITRIYGSYSKDKPNKDFKKQSKVKLIKKHLKNINKESRIEILFGNIINKETCLKLLDRDIIFLCTDDQWGRSIINQLAYQYMIPVINIGVRIDCEKGKINAGSAALHVLYPGKPCLWCYNYLKSNLIAAESMSKEEKEKLIEQKYIKGMDISAPSVISFTSIIASMAINIFLQMLTDFMEEKGDISCLEFDIFNCDIRRGTVTIDKNCICSRVKALGDYGNLHTIN